MRTGHVDIEGSGTRSGAWLRATVAAVRRVASGAAPRALLAVGALTLGARAHVPHDVVTQVRVSPAFAVDATLFATAVLTDHPVLLRSHDGGRSWTALGGALLDHGVVDLELSPDFAADRTMFACTASGGLWRSVDGGDSFQSLAAALPELQLEDLHLSPDFAVDRMLVVASKSGVYRSLDGGDSFTPISAGLTESAVARVVVAPDDPDVLLAGSRTLHRSDDGGASWAPLASFPWTLVALAPVADFTSSGVVMVGFGRSGGGLRVSVDGGASFAPAANGPSDPKVNEIVTADDGRLLAVTAEAGAFRASAPDGPWVLGAEGFEALSDQTVDHFRGLALSPGFVGDDTAFVAAFEGLFRSDDGGATWNQADVQDQRLSNRLVISPDYAVDGELLASNYGGGAWVHRRGLQPHALAGFALDGPFTLPEPAPHQRAWSARARNLDSLYDGVIGVSPDYAADDTLFFSFVGSWRSTDRGRSWQELPLSAFIARSIALSPGFAVDRTLFLGTGGHGSFVSHDAGDSWTELAGGLPPAIKITHFAMPPGFPGDARVWASSSDKGLWRSLDGGDTWAQLAFPAPSDDVRALALAPDGVTLLAGTVGGGLWRSPNGGDTWTSAWAGLPSAGTDVIESAQFSPDFARDDAAFVVSYNDGVFRSSDGGLSWSPASAGLPLDAPRVLAVSPDFADDRTLFVSTHGGIWRSRDAGASWARLPGYVRVDERHPAIRVGGAWTKLATAAHMGMGLARSIERGATHTLEFHGRSIAWHAVRSPFSGRAEVRVDGGAPQLVDLWAPAEEPARAVFQRRFAASGWHTIEVRVTGAANPLALGVDVTTDGFEYDD